MTLDALRRDLRFAVRTLGRSAGFTTFAVLIAGLGIGAVTTVFSVAYALLFRPLPFTAPDRLIWIANHESSGLSGQTTQVAHLLDLRDRAQTLESLGGYFAFYGVGDHVLTGRGEPERLSGVPVSANFFDVLGVVPAVGRTFNEDEGRWQGPLAVMLSHHFWTRRFEADRSVVGSAVTLNGELHTIVGVLPASFDFGSVFAPGRTFDLFFAFPLSPETSRWGNTMAMVGRLRPGISPAAAQTEMRTLGVQLTEENPTRNSFEGIVRPLAEQVSGRLRPALFVLIGAVAVVMLIVCANLCNLLLARTSTRQKEIAIRYAMGASRRMLVAQVLIEGLVLAGAGAIVGLALAIAGTRALAALDTFGVPLLATVRVDGVALALTAAVVIITGVVFGLTPAMQSPGSRLHDVLKDETRGSTSGRGSDRARSTLVVVEIAFACVLLVGAGLLIRSLVRVLEVDLGFESTRASTIRVEPDRQFTEQAALTAYYDDVLQRVRAMPGVEAAAITDAVPLGRNRTWGVRVLGVTYERGQAPSAFVRVVSDGYPEAMGLAVHAGRAISAGDTAASEPVVMINASMAAALFPGQDPIGRTLTRLCGADRRVVGVVGDVRHLALEQTAGNEMYLPMRQCPDQVTADLIVRSALPPARTAGAVRAALQPIAPTIAANEFRPMQTLVDRSVAPRRLIVLLLGGFAAFALILAALGIFALISYSVNRRTQEIGIRLALGATATGVTAGILLETLRLAAAGIVLGAIASWWLARSLSGLLYGVSASDPMTFAAMVALLGAVALLAGYLPARRAARVPPGTALRAM